ncbi:S1C family serine protease [Parenemella sanctibonifatiensis]|uniref:PDZ domain-containing protein n=1 Tax=Parenemella sanctibonifatiensis TaxID=2016505 RepID=A0A255EDG5_9ACTN|nr:trypsin-like peptidase domain-containing protein [Parenemella sanctibonifatiensis]OYN89587.1 hypothetical protein CGZ92_02365 [Parenemella sanctibonifatiensis]
MSGNWPHDRGQESGWGWGEGPQYGEPQYGQPQYGEGQHGQPQYGEGQHQQPPHGQHDQYGQQQYGQQQPQFDRQPQFDQQAHDGQSNHDPQQQYQQQYEPPRQHYGQQYGQSQQYGQQPRTDSDSTVSLTSPRPTKRRNWTIVAVCVALALIVGLGGGYLGTRLGAGPAPDPTPTATAPTSSPAPTEPQSPEEVADRVLGSTVTIQMRTAEGQGVGSGFIVDAEAGHIITNDHVVEGDGKVTVTFADGTTVDAEVLGQSPTYDVAVLRARVPDGVQALEIGDSDAVRVGQQAYAAGAPFGLSGTFTAGIVSAKHRAVAIPSETSLTTYLDALQVDTAINPGNSGGPLVDEHGRVIGINAAIRTAGSSDAPGGNVGLGFAIPINQGFAVAEQIIETGEVQRPVIRARVDAGSGGARLASVEADGPAGQAGLREGDVIIRVGDALTTTPDEVIVAILRSVPGDQIELEYERNGSPATAMVTLAGEAG